MSNKLPDRWLPYKPLGDRIKGTQFVAFKVPLSRAFNGKIEPNDRFSPEDLLEKCPNLSLIIDLTNTTRYYNRQEFTRRKVHYVKIFCPGHEVPDLSIVKRFFSVVDSFLKQAGPDDLIGIHCTHGVNRTGYFICRYMIQRLGVDPDVAISDFSTARGYPIERENYIEHLRSKLADIPPLDTVEFVLDPEEDLIVKDKPRTRGPRFRQRRSRDRSNEFTKDRYDNRDRTQNNRQPYQNRYRRSSSREISNNFIENRFNNREAKQSYRQRPNQNRYRRSHSREVPSLTEKRYNNREETFSERNPQKRFRRSQPRETQTINKLVREQFRINEESLDHARVPQQSRYRRSQSREIVNEDCYSNREETEFPQRYLQERFPREKLNEIFEERHEEGEARQRYPQTSYENRYPVNQYRERTDELIDEQYNKSETTQGYPQTYHQNQYHSTVTNPSYERDDAKRSIPFSNYRGHGSGHRGGSSQRYSGERKTKDSDFSGGSHGQRSNYRNQNATGTPYSWRKDNPQQNQLSNDQDKYKWVSRNSTQRETPVKDFHDLQ